MEGKIAHNNILLTLTQKLRLLDTLNKIIRRIVAEFLVSELF